MYERAETKGRQTLLRYRANQIADYEALYHTYFSNYGPDPQYIYYIGQSKNFEEWYNNIKDSRDPIYKDFEEKSTFTKRVFKEADYDNYSIWNYDENIEERIKDAENTKNVAESVKKDAEVLIERLKSQKSL